MQQGMQQGVEKGILQSIQNIMKNLGMTVEQAMEALEIPQNEQEKYLEQMKK